MFSIPGIEKKQIVGLAVTPNIGLEALVFDKDSNNVVKYGQKFIEYNIASREIQDYNSLRSAIGDLFNELEIQKEKANVYLVLPNVHFGFRSIEDPSIDSDAIESMILSDASESYLFKQSEPQSAFVDLNARTGANSKYIAHSSIQRKVVEEIQDACMDIGVNIVGIEGSTSAIPRGIALTGLVDDVVQENQNWDILLVNPNNYAIFQMSGSRILDYIEVPFAIMSFEGEEVYTALSSAVQQYLPNYPAKRLVIVSQTDNVSAELLKTAVIFDEEIVAVDSNKFSEKPCAKIAPSVIEQTALSMSPSALGASTPKKGGFATLNVMGDMSYDGVVTYGVLEIGDKEIELNSDSIMKFSILISGALLVLTLIVCGLFFGIASFFGAKAGELQTRIDTLNTEITELEKSVAAGITTLIKQISENNKIAINYYDSLSTDIPSHVWLTYYINKDGKEVGIEGFSLNINDIYEYFKSLKMLAPNSDIKLNKLEVFQEETQNETSDADDVVLHSEDNSPKPFAFEISNTKYEKSFDERGNKITGDNKNGSNTNDAKNAPAARIVAPAAKIQPKADSIPPVPDVEINLKEVK